MKAPDNMPPVTWETADTLVDYEQAVARMEAHADAMARGEAGEMIWLLEHPPFTLRAHQPTRKIWSPRIASRSTHQNAAGNIPIMVQGNGWLM